jgi:hypothetical protein
MDHHRTVLWMLLMELQQGSNEFGNQDLISDLVY